MYFSKLYKNKSATIIATLLIICLSVSLLPLKTFAATYKSAELQCTENFTPVYSNPNGIGKNITISVRSNNIKSFSVQMVNSSGKVIWKDDNAFPRNNGVRTFWCGKNVVQIQIKCTHDWFPLNRYGFYTVSWDY